MIGTTNSQRQPLDLAEQVARIEWAQKETRRFVAEQHKLIAEQSKLSAEASGLRVASFVTLTAAVVAAAGAFIAAFRVVARWLGKG